MYDYLKSNILWSESRIFRRQIRQIRAWVSVVLWTDGLNIPRNQRFWKAKIYHLLQNISSRKNARMWCWWWGDSLPSSTVITKAFLIQLGAGWSFVHCTKKILTLFSLITTGTKESVRLLAFLILGHPRLVWHHSSSYLLWNLIMLHIYRTIRMLHLLSFHVFWLIMSRLIGQSNLARLNLPHPEAVFEIGFFRRNPVPCTSYLFFG